MQNNTPINESPPPSDLPIDTAKEYLQAEDSKALKLLITDLHAADAAELIQQLNPAERQSLFVSIKGSLSPETITYLDEQVRKDLYESLSTKQLTKAIDHLESDDALDIIANLDEDRQNKLLKAIPAGDRALYEESLNCPEGSAGRLLRREVVTIPRFWTVGQTIDHLRKDKTTTPEHFYNIIVVGPHHKPIGMISLAELARSVRSTPVGKVMNTDIKPIDANMPQEELAKDFLKYALVEVPVIDEKGRLLGTITLDDVMFVMQDEYKDDLLKLGGVTIDDFYSDVKKTIRTRFSWLAVNLATAILASLVIAIFESAIEQIVALAILMPIVASMGGNAGTQTLTVAVRALATGELTRNNSFRIIYKEMLVGGLNGLIFAVIGGGLSWLWFGNPLIGIIIGLALIINLLVAGFAGAGIPLLLDKFGADPAVSSSVFLTTVTDVIGFLTFLGLAVFILL